METPFQRSKHYCATGKPIREATLDEVGGRDSTLIVTFQFAFSAIPTNW